MRRAITASLDHLLFFFISPLINQDYPDEMLNAGDRNYPDVKDPGEKNSYDK
jgi:hypothetical protein